MKRLYKSIITFICLVVCLLVLRWLNPATEIKEYAFRSENAATGVMQIDENTEFVQSVEPLKEFNQIVLYLDTADYSRIPKVLDITLYQNDSVVKQWTYNTGKHISENTITLKVGKILNESQQYALKIHVLDKSQYEEAVRFHSYEGAEGTRICMNLYKEYKNYLAIACYIIFLVTAMIWCVMRYAPLQHVAPVLILGMGLVMMLSISPMSGPDERYHYYTAYQLSNIIMQQEDVEAIDANHYVREEYNDYYNNKEDFLTVIKNWNKEYDDTLGYKNLSIERSNQLNFPITHFFSSLGITVGRILHLGFEKTYYLGRLFNLLVYVIITSYAIRITPKLKELFLLVSMLPICLQQASSYSYDALIISTSILFAAFFVRCKVNHHTAGWKEAVSMLLMIVVFSGNKLIYLPMAAIVLFMCAWRWTRKKENCVAFGIIGGIIALVIGVTFIIKEVSWLPTAYSNKFLFGDAFVHPLQFMKAVVITIIDKFGAWINGALGEYLAGFTIVIPEWVILGFLMILILAAARSKNNHVELTKLDKFGILGSFACMTVLLTLALWTDTNQAEKMIMGTQGRYFIPFLIPLLLVLVQNGGINWAKDRRKLVTVYFFLQEVVVITIFKQIG